MTSVVTRSFRTGCCLVLLGTAWAAGGLDSSFFLRFPLYVHTPQAFADRRIGFLPADPSVPLPVGGRDLWYLHVSGNLMREDWQRLDQLVQERHIPGLDFSGEKNILTLEDIRQLHDLRLLKLQGTRIGDRDLIDLAWMKDLEVVIVGDRITDEGIHRMGPHPRMVELGLLGCRLTPAGLELIPRYFPALERLDLTGTSMSDSGLKTLVRLPLKQLALPAGIADEGLTAFSGLKMLEQIDLSQTQVGDAGTQTLSRLPRLHTIFAGRALTDRGAESLSRIASLRRLDLSGTHVTDKGVQAIGRLRDMEELAFSQTSAGDAAIEALVPLRHLRFLEISDTRVTETGLKRLAAIPSLQVISFSASGSTDAGRFSAWRTLPRLHTVIINGRPMGYEWMRTLKGEPSSKRSFFQLIPDARADMEEGSAGDGALQVAQLNDRGPSGTGLTGLKRIHYVESELDQVIPAPTMINQDNQPDTEKNFLGEFNVKAAPTGKKHDAPAP